MGNEIPRPKTGVQYRIVGPMEINGMNVWRVHEVGPSGQVGQAVGPDCFSLDQAYERADDLIAGKKLFWFGHSEFVRKWVGE